MKQEIVLDVESTIFKIDPNKRIGTPFSNKNFLVLGGTYDGQMFQTWTSDNIPSCYDSSCLLIGFNIKFDLHWLRRYGTDFSGALIWDCQLAEHLLSSQRWVYPALHESCTNHGLAGKLDIVDMEFWSRGIDTDRIPTEILEEYLLQDLKSTWDLYQIQRKIFSNKPELFKLFRVLCEDLKFFEEIEANGVKYDTELSLKKANETKTTIAIIEEKIKNEFAPNIPINLDSTDHISALIYGGIIKEKKQLPIGVYKTGERKGETKYKWFTFEIELKRIFEPIKNSKLQKEGLYSTDEFYLQLLLQNTSKKEPKRSLIELLLKKRELSKLRSTYFEGFPDKIRTNDWADNLIHSDFNLVVTSTGRPSSSKPNVQNIAEGQKECIVSRHNDEN